MSCEKSKTVSFASSIEKNIADCSSGFPVNLICCIVLDQHQVLVVCLYLLRSSYNNFENNYSLAHNQLYNYLLEQLKSFECFHMLLNHFLLADQKTFFNQS